jgi:hypothetical protein
MRSYGFSARAAIAWLRMVRPGSVLGDQQRFLCAVEAGMASLAEAPTSVGPPGPRHPARRAGDASAPAGQRPLISWRGSVVQSEWSSPGRRLRYRNSSPPCALGSALSGSWPTAARSARARISWPADTSARSIGSSVKKGAAMIHTDHIHVPKTRVQVPVHGLLGCSRARD